MALVARSENGVIFGGGEISRKPVENNGCLAAWWRYEAASASMASAALVKSGVIRHDIMAAKHEGGSAAIVASARHLRRNIGGK
jgi:hypothetical protein